MNRAVQKKPVSDAEIKAKEREIKAEKERLTKQFAAIETTKKNIVEATIDDAAFCSVEMQYLRDDMNRNGVTSSYQNGDHQFGQKQSPSAELYIKMSQRLDAAIKTLLSCMPKERVAVADDGFDNFVSKRDKG